MLTPLTRPAPRLRFESVACNAVATAARRMPDVRLVFLNPVGLAMKQLLMLIVAFCLGTFFAFFLFLFAYFVVTDPGDNITLMASGFTMSAAGDRFVTGTLRNNTDRTFPRIVADVALTNADGRVVEDTFVTTSDLAAGATWTFALPVRAKDVAAAVVQGQCGREYWFRGEVDGAGSLPPHSPANAHRGRYDTND